MQSFPKPKPSLARQRVLAARARQHRSALNFPEQLLWHAVAGCKLGVYFRRQVVIGGRYIADLVAPSIRLVVEIDGRVHEMRRAADARRDERLRRLGYCVLRLDAQLVMHDLAVAVARVREAVGALGD
jgi:histidinol dehydrogenase/leucyl-tRNA synthetase/ATP-dependent DNA helicase RecG